MTRYILLLIAFLSTQVIAAPADNLMTEKGLVYYISFDVEFVTGMPEVSIEEHSCPYEIQKNAFISAISSITDQTDYSPYDIRAKAVFRNDTPYYINRDGIIRHGNFYFKISPEKFRRLLIPIPNQAPADHQPYCAR